jgi:hypothetical protein
MVNPSLLCAHVLKLVDISSFRLSLKNIPGVYNARVLHILLVHGSFFGS